MKQVDCSRKTFSRTAKLAFDERDSADFTCRFIAESRQLLYPSLLSTFIPLAELFLPPLLPVPITVHLFS